ncbi:MAG: hypothetical protein JXR71_07600 [Bacteroidales bacterium]|nr:hypothetical protein [Bacteroidales bacterium]
MLNKFQYIKGALRCKMVVFLMVFFSVLQAMGQTLPVGMPVLQDVYRRNQLLGKINNEVSFTVLPLFPFQVTDKSKVFDPDSTMSGSSLISMKSRFVFAKKKGKIELLPIIWKQQTNTKFPYGLNDGAMIPARGYQTLFSAGFYAQYGPLSIQLWPEVVYAQNSPYAGFPENYSDEIWAQYYWRLNEIDLPERFGNGPYSKITWGQSSIRFTFGPVSFGLSNENLWWGPGIRNTLVMTNNAAGFKHLTLNSVRPVNTVIGSFEWQLIAGRLEPSGYLPAGSDRTFNGRQLYNPKPDEWRFLSGVILTYHPKWVPGLFLGATRTMQQYHTTVGRNLIDYFPVFTPYGLRKAGGDGALAQKRSQLYSFFMRWLWEKGHGEVYFEYGRNDYYWDKRDLQVEPAYSGAFVVGFRKLVPLKNRKDQYLQIMSEFTQLAFNPTTINRNGNNATSWYTSGVVRAGYTHEGQIIGSGIGPGSNMQTLEVDWVKSLKMIGLRFERLVHNNDFFLLYIKDIRRNWVDVSATLIGQWPYKNLLFSGRIQYVRSMNYEWQFTPPSSGYWGPGLDVTNLHLRLGVVYRF